MRTSKDLVLLLLTHTKIFTYRTVEIEILAMTH